MYRTTQAGDEFIEKQVKNLLDAGMTKRCKTSVSSAVVVVRAPGRAPE